MGLVAEFRRPSLLTRFIVGRDCPILNSFPTIGIHFLYPDTSPRFADHLFARSVVAKIDVGLRCAIPRSDVRQHLYADLFPPTSERVAPAVVHDLERFAPALSTGNALHQLQAVLESPAHDQVFSDCEHECHILAPPTNKTCSTTLAASDAGFRSRDAFSVGLWSGGIALFCFSGVNDRTVRVLDCRLFQRSLSDGSGVRTLSRTWVRQTAGERMSEFKNSLCPALRCLMCN